MTEGFRGGKIPPEIEQKIRRDERKDVCLEMREEYVRNLIAQLCGRPTHSVEEMITKIEKRR